MKRAALILLVACAPSKKPAQGGGSGIVAPPVATATTCDGVKPRVEQLYRAEAQAKEPKRVDDAVADNTQMAMTDCAKDPGKLVPCLAKAGSVAELEKDCLIPLDDEGTEGK
jgi:hypothetical protein